MRIKAKLSRRSLFPIILMDGTIGIEIQEFFRLALLEYHDKDFLSVYFLLNEQNHKKGKNERVNQAARNGKTKMR